MKKNIKIGLFGFGCVGKGLWDVLHQTPGLRAEIVKICCKNKNKKRAISSEYFTFDKEEILNNPEINVIVELIDDAQAALEIVKTALSKKKAVVTANKSMISNNLKELLFLQNKFQTPLLYEGAVCASIPIIRNLEEYYDNDLLSSIKGIMNGTTNYILTKMLNEKVSFSNALEEAKEKGFAETNPILDLNGYDAKAKIHIILAHAYGLYINPEDILQIGIDKLNDFDSNYASEKGKRIKLVAYSKKKENNKIIAFVAPHFISKNDELYNVDNAFNSIITESCFAEKNIFIGKGAGAFPTASAVLSDISALSYDYKYEYKKMHQLQNLNFSNDYSLEIYLRYSSNSEINLNYFQTISEIYKNNYYHYAIGNISYNKLMESKWLEKPDIGVIINKFNGGFE